MFSLSPQYLLTDALAKGILDEPCATLDLRETAEWSLRVLARKILAAVMDSSLTLVNILVKKSPIYCNNTYYNKFQTCSRPAVPLTFAVVIISEFVTSPTANLSLATEGALCVDAPLSSTTVAGTQQTLIDV